MRALHPAPMSAPPIRSYGRVKARPLKPRQQQLLDELLPQLAIPDPAVNPLNLAALFPESSCVVLEIGFGGGEHLAAQAAGAPGVGFIGVEPFINGVGVCLRHLDEAALGNVRLHCGDARDVVAAAPDGAFSRVYILFPDPWPKKKHWKRRLIQPDFVRALARVVVPGGDVRFATDWKNYAATALAAFVGSRDFLWTADSAEDWRQPWPGHVSTRYEAKKLGDCAPIWLRFERTLFTEDCQIPPTD
jgi:tRNA (guanine-N7-)-methyltransferase